MLSPANSRALMHPEPQRSEQLRQAASLARGVGKQRRNSTYSSSLDILPASQAPQAVSCEDCSPLAPAEHRHRRSAGPVMRRGAQVWCSQDWLLVQVPGTGTPRQVQRHPAPSPCARPEGGGWGGGKGPGGER